MFKYLAAMLLLICLTESKADVAVIDPALSLTVGYERYKYTAWVNGEPVSSSPAPCTTVVSGFPLQQGSNHITVKMEVPPAPARPPIGLKVIALFKENPAGTGSWTEVEDYDEDGPYTNSPYVLESEFEIKSNITRTAKEFDSIERNKEFFENQARQLALKFITRLRGADEAEWTRIWGPGAGEELAARRRRYFGVFEMNAVSQISEMKVEAGRYFILVHAKDGLLLAVPHRRAEGESGFSEFVFARSNGKWCVRTLNRSWWTLPDEFQHN